MSEFKTLQATIPTIEVREITYVLDTIATVGLVLKFDGGADITKMGVCWSMDSVPTIDGEHVECSSDVVNSVSDGDLLFLNISGLEENTTYYVRAYAENKMGIAYSDSKSFITLTLPVVQTGEITDVQFSVVLNGVALFDGNDATTVYGFCWSEDENPTIENQSVVVSIDENSMFTYRLVDLQSKTKYYIRAYAQNKIGIVYGDVKDFTTADIPTIEHDYICEGDLYTGYGYNRIMITQDTMLIQIVSIPGRSDSVVHIYVDYIEKIEIDTTVFITQGEYFEFGEKTLVESGYYREVFISSAGCDSIVNLTLIVKSGVANYEYVDLGLSVKWATCNVGAEKPEEYGDYFAWGEVEPKENYDWSTYKYCVDNWDNFTKYCNDSYFGKDGFMDNKTVLEPEDDASTMNWGGAWRMPTKAEQDELRNNCTWTWITQSGVNGYKVTGPNSNSIFLPAAGYVDGGTLYNAGSNGYYWSSSLCLNLLLDAYSVVFYSGSVDWYGSSRCYGLAVRPVYGESSQQPEIKRYTISVYSHDNSRGTVSGGGTYNEGSQVTITATAKSGYKFKEWNDGNTDNPRVITVTKDAIYTAHFEAEKNLNAGHEYVDLGLPSGLKWATCNVGATTPEEYGDYFAWGEVEPKTTYNWSTYKYGTDEDQLTKYCNNSDYGKYGFTDNKTILDPGDDAATMNWGGSWRMPTKAEQDELRTKCTWDWTTQSGVSGYKVTGLNGNSIFLPAAGYMVGDTLFLAGSFGYYWSSSLYADNPSYAYNVYFYPDFMSWNGYSRSHGRSVRPVCL